MDDLVTVLVNGGIVAAFLEALKRALGTRFDWSRFGALLALGVGIATALLAVQLGWYPVSVTYGQAVFSGLMAGITASGLNRGVTQSPAAVVVQGAVQNGAPATATMTEPTVTASPRIPATLRSAPSNPIIPGRDDPPGKRS